ncbi:molybdopterin molybdotransferase MoeA [Microbacterium sp. SA39]|uniref:molybdopterin molybdotransferase MoeA n=1 Tax=Microbacterium sp. SA39 TaxID=1263625 RepID=UPI0005FA83AE|nr:gephyrin-like molybdotransferase Glp [Microbacterium sp. SA39]KJQ55711.1 Molybdopterin molybdenumtransferase [Microbacterium sp. SA39]
MRPDSPTSGAGSTRRTVEEHLAVILAATSASPAESVLLADAVGRTLAAPVLARVDVPLFDNSAMDGFAVRHADVADADAERPVTLRVVADIPAGSPVDPPLAPGEAARIMTGAPVPTAASAVIPVEDARGGFAASATAVVVTARPRSEGAHIRRRGEDVRAGAEVAPAGTVVGPLQAAAFAASGVDRVQVHRNPRVAVISTGSELAPTGGDFTRGQIPESNSILLASSCRQAGADVVSVTTVRDDDAAFSAALVHATEDLGADVVVTSGGVSAGAYEVVRSVLGDRISFVSVAMQPGEPQAFGRVGGALVFGLPGNPVSVAMSFEAFVRPALLALQGRSALHPPVLRLPAATGWRSKEGRRQFVPARIDRDDPSRWSVQPATAGGSGSHLAAGLARAEAYVVVPEDVSTVHAGDLVDVVMLS